MHAVNVGELSARTVVQVNRRWRERKTLGVGDR